MHTKQTNLHSFLLIRKRAQDTHFAKPIRFIFYRRIELAILILMACSVIFLNTKPLNEIYTFIYFSTLDRNIIFNEVRSRRELTLVIDFRTQMNWEYIQHIIDEKLKIMTLIN